MPNSADKPAELQNDSEVIELTDEVDEPAGDPDLDELGLAMPEFRVPGSGTGADEEERDDKPETEKTMHVAPDELKEELEADTRRKKSTEESTEEPFDRAELVKTVRMDAFDRAAVEAGKPQLEVDGYLEDQRYAPDVLVLPPRVLTKKWQDGAAVRPNGAPGPASPATASNRAALAETVKTRPPQQDAPREPSPPEPDTGEAPEPDTGEAPEPEAGESAAAGLNDSSTEALDIEAEAIEVQDLDEEPKPPPKPQPPAVKKAAKQSPGRVRRNTGPLEPPEPTTVPQAEADDDDLSGIVQELLDEKQKEKPAQQKAPEDKRHAWVNDVFGEEYFRTLPKDLAKQTERDVRFIQKSLGLQKGARLLDLACGFGRHSVQLAKKGFEVAGLDISMAMLQRGLSEAQRRGLSIKFIHGDMRELNFNGIFDACFCWQTSFGYFDDRTNVRVAKGVARALKPGGRFLIDVVNRDYVVAEMPSRTWWEGHECVFLEEVEFDNNFSVLHTKRSFIYEDGSPPREFSSFIRLYSLHELRQLLHFSGFRVVEVSGQIFHRGSFLGPASPRLIVLAEKQAPKE